ncbi:hypothetical protein D3C76_1484830 [compost metagenome]
MEMLEPHPWTSPDPLDDVVILERQHRIQHRVIFEDEKEQERRNHQQMELPVLLDVSARNPPVTDLSFGVRHVIRLESKLFFQNNSP